MDPDSALSSPGASRRARLWAAIAVPVVVVLSAIGLDVVDQSEPETLGGESARYVPPDGQRTVYRDGNGALEVVEHSRSIGVEGLLAAPPAVAAEVLAGLTDVETRTAQWWRVTRTTEQGISTTDLYRLSANGIAQVAAWGGTVGFVFEPELPLLPAVVRPNDTWRASGSALADGALVYDVQSSAFAVVDTFTDVNGAALPLTGGCIGVDSTLTIEAPADALATEVVDSSVWCPGRGVVWTSGTVDGQPRGQAEERPRSIAPVERGLPATDDRAPSSPTSFSAPETLPLVVIDPFFGQREGSVQFSVAPVALPDGRLVIANDRGDDLQWWRLEPRRAELDAAAHPGGAIITIAAVGDRVIATTAQRAVVAYDGWGRRLWQWRGPELVLTQPLAVAGAGREADVLVVDRGGQVTLLSGETGEPRWSVPLGADARPSVALTDTAVVLADERGRVHALELSDGTERWRVDAGFVEGAASSPEAGAVALQLESGEVVVLDAADGAELFTVRYPGIARSLLVTARTVFALSDERLTALSLDDGSELWRDRGGLALVSLSQGAADAVAVLDATGLRLIASNDGTLRDDQPLESATVSATRRVVATGATVVVVDSDGRVVRSEVQ